MEQSLQVKSSFWHKRIICFSQAHFKLKPIHSVAQSFQATLPSLKRQACCANRPTKARVVIKSMGSRRYYLKMCIPTLSLLATWPWANFITSLCLGFLRIKIRITSYRISGLILIYTSHLCVYYYYKLLQTVKYYQPSSSVIIRKNNQGSTDIQTHNSP